MSKMHEVLACEKTVEDSRTKSLGETRGKFEKVDQYFRGHTKTLKMIAGTDANAVLEKSATENKSVVASVVDTLKYSLDLWAKAENLQIQKNLGNTIGKADIVLNGKVILADMPIDEVMGLENRLTELRALFSLAPTLDASKVWEQDGNRGPGFWREKSPEVRTKTEKKIDAKVLYEATEHHPAQVKEFSYDEVVGSFETTAFSGALTSLQKAKLMTRIDELILAVKKARVECNQVEVPAQNAATALVAALLEPIL